MDILTQMVLGGAVSAQVLKNEPTRKTILVGCTIAAIPDLDVLLMFNSGDYEELILHRSFSHAILPFLLLSLIFLLFNNRVKLFKSTSQTRFFSNVFLILLSHALLDCLTTWGTELFWPLDLRIATQTVFVIDLFYSVTLGLGLLAYFIFFNKKWALRLSRWTLVLSTLYLVLLISYQQYFISKISEHVKFSKALRVNSQPNLFSPFKLRAVVELSDTFYISKKPFDVFDDSNQNYFAISKNHEYIVEMSDYLDLYPLFNLSRGYLSIEKSDSNIYKLSDLRYGPINSESDVYESVFTYYVIIKDDKAVFKQNMRTGERMTNLFKTVFSDQGI